MGGRNQKMQHGFTIIEVMLFLGITGLMAATLLGGWSVMINTQRYKDSRNTLQSFIQEQYNLVYNVENGRGSDLSCTDNGAGGLSISDQPSTNTPPGQSACVIMGRYITVQGGNHLTVTSIVGLDQTPDLTHSDIQQIQDFKAQRVDAAAGLTRAELDVPWQAFIVGTGGDLSAKDYVIAIVRAPSSGVVHTFTEQTSTQKAVNQLATAAHEQADVNLCLDPGVPISGPRTGIVIGALASAQSSVKTIPNGGAICQ